MSRTLATVDVSSLFRPGGPQADTMQATGALVDALTHTGFAILRGTGVPAQKLAAMRNAVTAVFNEPRQHYRDCRVQKNNYRGYVPLSYFTPNAGGARPDRYEAWKLHWEVAAADPICQASALYGPNRWPAIAFNVKAAVLAYWAEMDRLNAGVLGALADGLGMDSKLLLSCLEQPLTNMTLLNYPPSESPDANWGIHPHKDFNFLTFLAHDPVGGLEVRTRDGQWIDARCEADEYVVNIGDMLELMSGGRLVSTPHRVTNRGRLARQSFPYFSVPRFDVVVQPLLPPLEGFSRASLQSGAASHDIWYSNWPDEAIRDASIDLGNYL